MKTLKSKLILALTLVTCALMQTACPGPKGGGNAGPQAVCYGGVPCVNGGGGGTLLAQALGKSSDNQFSLGLIFNTQDGVNPAQTGSYYTGGAIATGNLIVASPYPYMECPIPAGSYVVTTVAPAQWSMQSFQNMQIEARGPAILEISLPNNFILEANPAVAGNDGILYPFHLQLDMYVLSVNGQPCTYNGYNFGDIVLE